MKPPSLLIAVPVFYAVLFVMACALTLIGSRDFEDISGALRYVGMLFWYGHTAYLYENLQRTVPLWWTLTIVIVLAIGLALTLWKLRGWYRVATTLVLLLLWQYFGLGILFTNL